MRKDILTSVFFLLGLTILLANDLILKQLLHNWFSGKLSDFAGVLVFSLFFTAFLPRFRLYIFIITALFFIYWKSPFSQSAIDFWNSFSIFKVGRVVDYSDLMALIMLLPAWLICSLKKLPAFKLHPAIISILVLFAFTATSYVNEIPYGEKFEFDLSKQNLVRELNRLSRENIVCGNKSLSLLIENADTFIIDGQDTSWYSVKGTDSIYQHPIYDTAYIGRSGLFLYSIPVEKYMPESKTGYCTCLPALLRLDGNDERATIVIEKFTVHNCMGLFEKEASANEKSNLMKAFQNEVINKIKAIE